MTFQLIVKPTAEADIAFGRDFYNDNCSNGNWQTIVDAGATLINWGVGVVDCPATVWSDKLNHL